VPSSRIVLVVVGALIVAGLLLVRLLQPGPPSGAEARRAGAVGCADVARAYGEHRSAIWLTVSAPVLRALPDSYGRFQHQRFLIRCASGQTVLIENDVTVGRRAPVRPGDTVVVRGQYVWNQLGGLIHFTHGGGGSGGWIYVDGKVYALRCSLPGHCMYPRNRMS